MSKRTVMEVVEFEIAKSQCDVIREISGADPAEIAKKYLVEYSRDGRATPEETVITSVSWLPEVWAALVKQVGIGGVSEYIRAATFAAAKKDKIPLDKVETWKFGHKESAGRRRRMTSPKVQTGRQSIVCPIILPKQWWVTLTQAASSGELGCDFGRYIKAATQNKLQKDTGVKYPVQRGLSGLVDE
jgi:hypothetical protein